MAYLEKKLYNGTPGTTSTTLYTVPASTTTIVKEILVCNTTSSPATITVTADATPILSGVTVPANDILAVELSVVLETTDVLAALQGTAAALTVYASGIEVT